MFQENLFSINGKYEQNVFVDFMYTCEVQSSFNSSCFIFLMQFALCCASLTTRFSAAKIFVHYDLARNKNKRRNKTSGDL